MQDPMPEFEHAVKSVGLDVKNLKVEGFRTDGTSNYLANLNYRGQTWAAALRLPARGAEVQEFLDEKQRALIAVEYLVEKVAGGIDVGFNCQLKFGGVSTLVASASTQTFLRKQHSSEPLRLLDHICGREKVIKGLVYPDCLASDAREYVASYNGPFYLSRGAPAWETLEEYPELEEPAAHAIAALHLRTGFGDPVSKEDALTALEQIRAELICAADSWTPQEGSKEATALAKSMKKWSGTADERRRVVIRRERFLRTSTGREVYRSLFEKCCGSLNSDRYLRSFCHGDSHGGNYIIVRYQYWLSSQDALIDRVFLNEVFQAHPEVDGVYVNFDGARSAVLFGLKPESETALLATRRLHHEIHPIDLDAGTGTSRETKVLHLYDALLFSVSLDNITTLFATPVTAAEVLAHYYDGLLS